MSILSDKLANLRIKINCRYSVAQMQMCTLEDTHGRLFKCAILDDVMSQNELTTSITPSRVLIWVFRSLLTPSIKNPDTKTQMLHFEV